MNNLILSALAEQRKEHGYSILAASQDVYQRVKKFHRVPSQQKGARLLYFGFFHFRHNDIIT